MPPGIAKGKPNLEAMTEELRLAQQWGVGVMAMKTMKGLKGLDSEVAYLKKLLSNPAVTTVTKGIGSFDMFDAYLAALKEPLTAAEDRALYRYAQANRSNNCMLCDECKQACPLGVGCIGRSFDPLRRLKPSPALSAHAFLNETARFNFVYRSVIVLSLCPIQNCISGWALPSPRGACCGSA